MRGYRENESGSRSFGVTREGKKDSSVCIALAKKKKETSSSAERVGGGKEKGGGG